MNNPDLQSMSKEELIDLAKVAIPFKSQQVGKRPEFFQRYLNNLVKNMAEKPTLENVLYLLELEAVKRDTEGEKASPVERLNRIWQIVTYHHPKRGRLQMPFATLKNKLTQAKKYKNE